MENNMIIQRYYDAFNRRDLASYERLFTRDCLIEAPGVQLRGIDGARGFDQVWQNALPDAKLVNLHMVASGNVVLCENRIVGRHTGTLATPDLTLPPSGRVFDRNYMAAFELDGERIKRQTLHFDRVQVLADLGTDNVAVARGIYEAFNTKNMQKILDSLDDDVSWGIESVATEVKPYGIRHGKAGVASFFAAWGETAEFHRFEASNFVAAGDHVYNTLAYELTVKATGKRVKTACSAQHWTFKNGKIIRWRGFEDTAATREGFMLG